MSAIEQLFNGEVGAYENFSITEEYKRVNKEYMHWEELLIKLLSSREIELFENLKEAKSEYMLIEAKAHFTYGFKLGFCLANEARSL